MPGPIRGLELLIAGTIIPNKEWVLSPFLIRLYGFMLVLPLLRSKRTREPSGAEIKQIEASEQLSAHELL